MGCPSSIGSSVCLTFHDTAMQGNDVRPALPSLLSGEDLLFESGNIMSAHGKKHASLRAAWLPMFFSGRRAPAGRKPQLIFVHVNVAAVFSKEPFNNSGADGTFRALHGGY